MISTTEIQ